METRQSYRLDCETTSLIDNSDETTDTNWRFSLLFASMQEGIDEEIFSMKINQSFSFAAILMLMPRISLLAALSASKFAYVFRDQKMIVLVGYRSMLTSTVTGTRKTQKMERLLNNASFGITEDTISWNEMITRYAQNGRMEDARRVFEKMHERSVVSWNALLAGYIQNGRIEDARQLFDRMDERNVVSWTAMISGYAQNSRIDDARQIFDNMQRRDVVSWNAMLNGYVQNGNIDVARQLFDKMPERNVVSWSTMITGFAQNKAVDDARELFDRMPIHNVVSWTAMIAGYSQNGHAEEAMKLFAEMRRGSIKPNQSTFTTVLSACAMVAALEPSKQVHACLIKYRFESDVFVGSALVTAYAKCGTIDYALKLFDRMSRRNVVSWTAMIAGHAQNGRIEDALHLFDQMPERDAISWTAMVAGYAQNGHGEEALKLFLQMQRLGMKCNQSTYLGVLNACGSLAVLEQSKQVHAHTIKMSFRLDNLLGNALITVYSKCGSMADARHVFDKMPELDVVSWNAIIGGYGQHGYGKEAIWLFERMEQAGMKPDQITFVGVLSACSHAGLVTEGWHYFESMSRDYCIPPKAEHYACMVDLLGRSGCLNEAGEFINRMPFEPDAVVWKALLGACRIHVNVELGKLAAERIFELEPQNSAAYVLLANIYAVAGRWNDAAEVRLMMKDFGVKKIPGCSWIEVKNRVHAFVAGDRLHPEMEKIYATLEALDEQMKEAGYVRVTKFGLFVAE